MAFLLEEVDRLEQGFRGCKGVVQGWLHVDSILLHLADMLPLPGLWIWIESG